MVKKTERAIISQRFDLKPRGIPAVDEPGPTPVLHTEEHILTSLLQNLIYRRYFKMKHRNCKMRIFTD
jgi:hypothetical protein